MQMELYTGRSQVILMILIPFSPYPFLKDIIFRHEFVHEFFMNLSMKFVQIRMNSYEFLHEKLVML